MTAEGDNSVLMQKVAKELLASIQEKTTVYPKFNIKDKNLNFTKFNDLVTAIKMKEAVFAGQVN